MTVTTIRTIRLAGPRLDARGARYLWVADLAADLVHFTKSVAPDGGFVRNPSLRILTEVAEPRDYIPVQGGKDKVLFRDPLLFQAAVRGEAGHHGVLRLKAGLDGGPAGIPVSHSAVALSPDAPVFDIITTATLAPNGAWPSKEKHKGAASTNNNLREAQIQVAPLSLQVGIIEVAIRDEGGSQDLWDALQAKVVKDKPQDPVELLGGGVRVAPIPIRTVKAFDHAVKLQNGKLKTKKVKGRDELVIEPEKKDQPRIALALTPLGIEFEAEILGPLGGVDWHPVRLRIEPDGENSLRLALVADHKGALRSALADLMEANRRGRSPAVIDLRPGEPPLVWPLAWQDGRLKLPEAQRPMIAPGAVRAAVVTEPVPGARLPATATLNDPRLTIDATAPIHRLVLEAGTVPSDRPVAAIDLTFGADLSFEVGLGVRTDEEVAGPLPVTADRDILAADLEARYRAKELRRDGDKRPLFAFLALERGAVQVPVPPRKHIDEASGLAGVQAFTGLAFARLRQGGQWAGDVTVDAARYLRAELTFNGAALAGATIAFRGAEGVIGGALWAVEATPSAEEILPTLAAGPIALWPLPLSFGVATQGWSGRIGPFRTNDKDAGKGAELSLDVEVQDDRKLVHWAPVPGARLPLVAAMAMTRTSANAAAPSQSRDLVPVFYSAKTVAKTPLVTLRAFAPGLPVAKIAAQGADVRFGWPDIDTERRLWTNAEGVGEIWKAGVALSVLTLPGVEGAPVGTDGPTPGLDWSLRYDLPILGELFAQATLVRALPEEEPGPAVTALDLPALEREWEAATRRLALTRTQGDRATGWGTTDSLGLVEPFAWDTGFKVDDKLPGTERPFGAYALNSGTNDTVRWTGGEEALAGLTARFREEEGRLSIHETNEGEPPLTSESLQVTGFALAPYNFDIGAASGVGDTRGFALARKDSTEGTLRVRASGLRKTPDAFERRDLVTTTTALPLEVNGTLLELWLRDLPMVPDGNGGWSFAADGTPEAAPGPDAGTFDRDQLPRSVYEWRLFAPPPMGEDGRQPAYEIAIGSLTLRPRRLWETHLGPGGRIESASVICSVGPPRRGPDDGSGKEPFGAEAPYEAGNAVVLRFTTEKGICRASEIASCRIAEADGQPARIDPQNGNEALLRFDAIAAALPGGEVPVRLSMMVKVEGGRIVGVVGSGTLEALLFGRPTILEKGEVELEADGLRVTVRSQDPVSPETLAIRKATLNLRQGALPFSTHCTLTLEGTAGFCAIQGQAAIEIGLDGKVGWCGALVKDVGPTGGFEVDHERGAILLRLGDAPCQGAWIRGLPLDGTKATGLVAIALDVEGSDRVVDTFRRRITAARFDVVASGEDAEVRQLAWLATVGPEEDRRGARILVNLPTAARLSSLSWPVGRLAGAAEPYLRDNPGPFLGESRTPQSVTLLKDGVTLRHEVTPRLVGLPLGAELLRKVGGEWRLFEPWRVKVLTTHRLTSDHTPGKGFETIDDVTIVDIAQVAKRLAAAGDDLGNAHAFLPRYRDGAMDYLPTAGIARVGLFGHDIDRLLATGGGAAPQLAMLGGAVVELPLDGAGNSGLMFPLPWIAAVRPGASIAPLDTLPQAPPAAAETKVGRVAAFDLAGALPARLGGPPRASLGFRTGASGASDLRRTLEQVFGAEAARPRAVVNRAFAANLFPQPTTRPDRPLFWRALMALARAWRMAEPGWGGVATLLARPADGDAVRARVSLLEPVEEPLPAGPASDLLVLGRARVAVAPAPPDVGVDREDGALARYAGSLSAMTAEPLAAFAAPAEDPDASHLAPDRRLHGKVRRIDLPVAYDLPRRLSPLRDRWRTIHSSAALGWPRQPLGPYPLRIGAESPVQDAEVAWAGRSRTIAGPRLGAAGSRPEDLAKAAEFLAVGRRVLFSRGSEGSEEAIRIVAPPDRALTPVAPRVRVPRAAEIAEALAKTREGAGLAPLLPGRFDLLSTGARPGALAMEHEGFLRVAGDVPFDPVHDRFGRAADRGPVIWRQGRAPRSTGLPRTIDLARSRRTFVGMNFVEDGELQPFALLAGPGTVLRYDPATIREALDEAGPSAVLLTIATPSGGLLGPQLDETVGIVATRPGWPDGLVEALARLGLLRAGLRAQLRIGEAVATFGRLRHRTEAGGVHLTLVLAPGEIAAARAALATADADTRAEIGLRLAPVDAGISLGTGDGETEIALDTASTELLVPGPPRTLTVPLPLAPTDRPWRPIESATLAFGDPSYDRELGSVAPSVVRTDTSGREILLAADRAEYDRSETVRFSFGIVNPRFRLPQPEGEPFESPSKAWTVHVEHQPRPLPDGSASASRPLRLIRALEAGAMKAMDGQAYAIPLAALLDAGTGRPARLEPGDRLVLSAAPPDGTPVLSLDLGIVAEPVVSPPAALYGLVTLDGEAATPALVASAPRATLIEFPDLLADLVRGFVRRRALFVWPFVPRLPVLPGDRRAGLVKVDRTGGGQIPSRPQDFPSALGPERG